jgi:hypothetical protein
VGPASTGMRAIGSRQPWRQLLSSVLSPAWLSCRGLNGTTAVALSWQAGFAVVNEPEVSTLITFL